MVYIQSTFEQCVCVFWFVLSVVLYNVCFFLDVIRTDNVL